MKKLLISTALMTLLLVFSNANQASNKHDNQHRAEHKRDRVNNSSPSHNRKITRKQRHTKQTQVAHSNRRLDAYISSHHGRKAYRKHRRYSEHRAQQYYTDHDSYTYHEPYYARSHSDYYGRYYGYYDRYGRYQAYDYGRYDNYGRYQAHQHNSHCGHISTPVIGAVVAGLVIASIFD